MEPAESTINQTKPIPIDSLLNSPARTENARLRRSSCSGKEHPQSPSIQSQLQATQAQSAQSQSQSAQSQSRPTQSQSRPAQSHSTQSHLEFGGGFHKEFKIPIPSNLITQFHRTWDVMRERLRQTDSRKLSLYFENQSPDCIDRVYQALTASTENLLALMVQEKNRPYIPRLDSQQEAPDFDTAIGDIVDSALQIELAHSVIHGSDLQTTAEIGIDMPPDPAYGYSHGISPHVNYGVNEPTVTFEYTGIPVRQRIRGLGEQNDLNSSMVGSFAITWNVERRSIARREVERLALVMEPCDQLFIFFLGLVRRKYVSRVGDFDPTLPTPGISIDAFCDIVAGTANTGISFFSSPDIFEESNKDLEKALRGRSQCSDFAHTHVRSLLQYELFNNWLIGPDSGLLLVDANLVAGDVEELSAMSSLCATLATSLINVWPNDIVIHFFCGLHPSFTDPWSGPDGLLRSILLQILMRLLEWGRLDLGFVNESDHLDGLKGGNIDCLCDAIHRLILQLPEGTVIFCMIDSITNFDNDSELEELQQVMTWLHFIVMNERLARRVKFLLANPTCSSTRIRSLLMPNADMNVPLPVRWRSRCISL